MMTKVNETKTRSIFKGITARVIEVLVDTVIIISLLGVDIHVSLGIAILIEGLCFLANYINERLWNFTDWGRHVK